MKKRLVFFLFFLFGIMLSGNLMAQEVVVVRSSQKTQIGGKTYYMHHVKQGQTLYSISKAYNVTVEEIEKLNPEVKNGLKAGLVLGIPVRPVQVQKEEEPQPEIVVVEPEPEPEPEEEPEPVVEEPEPEPEPEEEPEPVVEEPEPEPEPEEEPEPVVEEPEPEPEPEEEPEPVVEEPEPEPEPEEEPEPVVEEPEPVVEQPQIVEVPAAQEQHPERNAFFEGSTRIVQHGEDLYDIAKEFGIDLADFKAVNPGLTDEPKEGTRIVIPNIVNENDYIVHSCERNERVSSLLKRWKVDENDFRKKNISVGSHVFTNQVVLIPIQPITDFYWIGQDGTEIVEAPEVPEAPVEPQQPMQEDAQLDFDFETGDIPDCRRQSRECLKTLSCGVVGAFVFV